jgi:hypothetical protein
MPRHRSIHRKDTNQNEIVDFMVKRGATVVDTSMMGEGFPDILIGYKFFSIPAEIKHPGIELNERQRKWHQEFAGAIPVLETIDDAATLLRSIEILTGVLDRASRQMDATIGARFIITQLMSSWRYAKDVMGPPPEQLRTGVNPPLEAVIAT